MTNKSSSRFFLLIMQFFCFLFLQLYGFHLFFRNKPGGFYCKDAVIRGLPDPLFGFHIAVSGTVGNTIIMPAVYSKPADFFL